MANKAIILSRVSSEQQTLEQQTEAVRNKVLNDGYLDEDIIIIEDKESAIKLSEEERNGLNRMKEYIENDSSINAVYLYEISRLSRRQAVLFSIRDYLLEHNIQLVCMNPDIKLLDENGKMSFAASMLFSIFTSMSESEMELKKVRMMRGRRHNISIGKIGSGRPPFGYTINRDKYYVIDPEQSEIVKRFFLQYSKGDTTIKAIAQELKEEGLFPNTSLDTLQQNLLKWLESDHYIGIKPYPQIISKSLFEKVQSVRQKRKQAPKKKHNHRFLLKGLIYDEKSKRPLCGWYGGDGYILTHCNDEGMMIKRKLIDPIVWEYAKSLYRQHIMNPTIFKRQLKKTLEVIGKKIDTINAEIKSIRAKIDKVEERMIFGNLSSKRGDELIESLKEDLSDKERRLLELTNETIEKQHQLMDAEIRDEINEEEMSLEDKIALVQKVVKKITIIRTKKLTSQISIFNHINNTVSVYEIIGKPYSYSLIKEYNRKE